MKVVLHSLPSTLWPVNHPTVTRCLPCLYLSLLKNQTMSSEGKIWKVSTTWKGFSCPGPPNLSSLGLVWIFTLGVCWTLKQLMLFLLPWTQSHCLKIYVTGSKRQVSINLFLHPSWEALSQIWSTVVARILSFPGSSSQRSGI